jgi:hypothetical protein
MNKKIPVLSFILSAVVAWLLIPVTSGFPMVPFFILFTCLSTLVYVIKKERTWFDTALYSGILGLSSFLLIRSNEVLQFIDFVFIIIFGSLLILPPAREHSLINLLLTPLSMMKESLIGKNIFPYSFDIFKKFRKVESAKSILLSTFITLLFLIITIPLLASANPFFNQLLENLLNFLNLMSFIHYFNEEQIMINIVRFFVLIFLVYALPRALTASVNKIETQQVNLSLPVNYLIPKVAMALVLIVFFITQAQLYFATPLVLQSMGYTNSRLTNEVFFQVTIVAGIVFFLAFLDTERKKWNKRLTYFLILESFFLVGIAFKSVVDYSFLYGFTEKRLWGYATMSWLTGSLFLFLYYYKKEIPQLRFFQLVLTYTIIILLGINISNFDYLIAHFSNARTQSGIDYAYMSRLSSDSEFYPETLTNLVMQIDESDKQEPQKIRAVNIVLKKIDFLKQKYQNTSINSFNVSEYREYLRIKDIDTEVYRKRLSEVEQEYN